MIIEQSVFASEETPRNEAVGGQTGTENPVAGNHGWPPELKGVVNHVQHCFQRARGSHGWDHTLRVYRLCERIGSVEGADLSVLRAAALLHDIGRIQEDESNGGICHAQKGAELARPLVGGLALTTEQKKIFSIALAATATGVTSDRKPLKLGCFLMRISWIPLGPWVLAVHFSSRARSVPGFTIRRRIPV